MKQIIIKTPKYELVENVDTDIYLPTKAIAYDLGRSEYLGVYPKFLKGQDTPFEYRWIHLIYDAFNTSIQKGRISTHEGSLERLNSIRGYDGLGYKDKINIQLLDLFMDSKSYEGDYSREYFEEQLDLATRSLKEITNP